jgi:4-hydroxy-3-methylbut-2-enyl diphosphate reductase
MENTYFRKGFGLKNEIAGRLTADYHSSIVEALRSNDYCLSVGGLTFRLAREFGFCYGVDRAVEYAYETRTKFPGRRLFLVGEIIHNPHVNQKLCDMGITLLGHREDGDFDFSTVTPDDVVIMPAFGVTMRDFERLRAIGCVLVDTTCGSVLNVWKRVESYARDGFTAIIHGKHYHEETKATASQVMKYPNGRYLVVFDMNEARLVCDFLEGRGSVAELESRFRHAVSPGFDFERDLARVGLANQTTMSPKRFVRAWCAVMAPTLSPSTSARSTRSAQPPRNDRTRCCRCYRSLWMLWWWSADITRATPAIWRRWFTSTAFRPTI